MADAERGDMKRLVRLYSITSLVCMIIASVLVALVYRRVAVDEIYSLAKANNAELAQVTLNTAHLEVGQFLASVSGMSVEEIKGHPVPPHLIEEFQEVQPGTSMASARLYNDRGMVAYSTYSDEIGADKSDSNAVQRALKGDTVSDLSLSNMLSQSATTTEAKTLVETYLPARASAHGPVLGVFELYSDVSSLASQIKASSIRIFAGTLAVFAFLYGALVVIVRRAGRTVEAQQRIIEEKSQLLRELSAHFLQAEEVGKQRIANELHEGVLQTLAATKLTLESAHELIAKSPTPTNVHSLGSLVPVIRDTMRDIQAIASALRPPNLDDFGLVSAMTYLRREYRAAHPGLEIELQIGLEEPAIPATLRIVIFRIIERALQRAVTGTNVGRVTANLAKRQDTLVLTVSDTGSRSAAKAGDPSDSVDDGNSVIGAKEYAVLSGGLFTARIDASGATTITATWPVGENRAAVVANISRVTRGVSE